MAVLFSERSSISGSKCIPIPAWADPYASKPAINAERMKPYHLPEDTRFVCDCETI
jgi:hypothetical protein